MRPKQISDLMGRGEKDDNITVIIDRLMQYRFQQFSEIMKMPILLVEKLIKRIDKQIEAENKAYKK